MIEILISAALILGATFIFLAALGLLRLPDVYNRMHATTKGTTVGLAGVLVGAILVSLSTQGRLSIKLLAAVIFLFLTAPVGAHMVARSAYHTGTLPYPGTIRDDMAGKVKEMKEVG